MVSKKKKQMNDLGNRKDNMALFDIIMIMKCFLP